MRARALIAQQADDGEQQQRERDTARRFLTAQSSGVEGICIRVSREPT